MKTGESFVQSLVHKHSDHECNALLNGQPVQLAKNRHRTIMTSLASNKASGCVLKSLQSADVIGRSPKQQRVAVVQMGGYHGIHYMFHCRLSQIMVNQTNVA